MDFSASTSPNDCIELPLSDVSQPVRTDRVAVSLFSGAGGLDLGIAVGSKGRLKFDCWVEADKDCRETLVANVVDDPQRVFGDIRTIHPKQMLEACSARQGEVFLIAGGPPCQSFSTAGQRASVHDPRGEVVDCYLNAIRKLKPRFFVFENVRGLLSVALKHQDYNSRIQGEINGERRNAETGIGSVFQKVILPAFERLGYEIVYGLVNAADYGTAQVRHRLVILGSRDREFGSGNYRKITGQRLMAGDLLPKTHDRIAPYPPISRWRTLHDAIGHLRNVEPSKTDVYTYSDERKAIWARMPPGEYWTYIRDNPEKFPEGLKQVLGGAYESGGGKVGFWRRLAWDRPSPTLPTQPQHQATGLCHPDFERPLSIQEYAAIQDFPPNYQFIGNKSSRYAQIGNAVPVRLGEAIGQLFYTIAEQKV